MEALSVLVIALLEAIDWGPDTINTLLGFVPERFRANVEAVLATLTAFALFLAAVRKFMEKVAPRLSSHPIIVAFDRVFNWFAVNSRRLEVRPEVQKHISGAPPRQPTIVPPPPPGDES